MIKKIPCGGFSYDDSEITFENGVIHPIGGGGGAEPIIFGAYNDEGYAVLEDGKKAVDIGDALENNIGRVFVAVDNVLYLVMANPATYNGKFAMSPEKTLTSYADGDTDSFNLINI